MERDRVNSRIWDKGFEEGKKLGRRELVEWLDRKNDAESGYLILKPEDWQDLYREVLGEEAL